MGLSLKKIGRSITDIFDANSKEDQRKRMAAGQSRYYADQQRAMGNQRPANNLGQAFLGNAARTINTVGGAVRETPSTLKLVTAMATNNAKARDNALEDVKKVQQATRNPNAGLFGAGTIYKNANDTPLMGETAKRFGTSYLAGAGELAPIPATKTVKGANLAIKAGKVGLASSAANVAADAGNQYINKGKIDLKQSAVAGGTGLALGTAAPVAWAGTKGATKLATNKVSNLMDSRVPLNQAGGIKINNPLSAKTGLLINNPDGAKYGGLKINNPDGAQVKPIKVTNPMGAKVKEPPIKVKNNTGAPLVGENLSGAAQQAHLGKIQNVFGEWVDNPMGNKEAGFIQAPKVGKGSQGSKSVEAKPLNSPVDSSPNNTTNNPEILNARLNNAADNERNRYNESFLTKAKNKVMETYNPTNPLAKIDRRVASAQGKAFRDLPADQRLEHLHDVSSNSRQQTEMMLNKPTKTRESVADMIRHYGDGNPASKEVNNYHNAMFDLEFRAKHGKPIQAGVSTSDLKAFVKAYEAKDPNARQSLATKKAANDMAVDNLVEAGAFTKAEGELVKNSYQNAVPLGRLVSDNLERVQIGGKSVGSISKQTVVQSLTGNSHIPLDNTFKPLVDRLAKSVQQGNKTKLAQAYADRVQQGLAPGELLVGAGNKVARKDLTAQRVALNKGIAGLNKEISINGKWARKLQTEINNLNKAGLNKSLSQNSTPNKAPILSGNRDILKGVKKVTDPMRDIPVLSGTAKTVQFSRKMTAQETKSMVDNLVNLPSKDILKIQSKIATREPKLATRLGQIAKSQKNIEDAQQAKSIIKEQVAQLQDDPTTGRQVISGLMDGQPYKIEVPPEIARVMQGLDQTQLKGVLKVGYTVNKVFQTAWTGFIQPIFSLVSYALYDPAASVIISKHGYKTFRPSAVGQMFKSFTGTDDFSKALKRNGYLSPGGSMLAQDSVLSAEKIAASKDIFSKMKFNIKNPSEMLASIDILGGKLANSTRERIAMAHYVAAKKANMSEAQAMQEAVYAANNVLPNYQRTAHLMKEMNAILAYSSASVAGTRSITRALGSDPAAWARLASVGLAPVAAATAYSLSSDSGQEFYKDMKASGKEYVLDNNVVIVLPGAHKDGKTGLWTGVWKIPVAPELRAINKTAWRATATALGQQGGFSPQTVALTMFDTMTGGLRGQSNPAVDTAAIALNIDPRTGKPVVKGNMANEPKKDQAYDTTSTVARKFSDLTGNRISPIQADKIVGQFSLSGELLQNKSGNPAKTLASNATRKFYGAYGETDSAKYYKGVDKFTATLSPSEKAIYAKTNPTKKNSKGEIIFEPTKLTKASDYGDMIANPDYTVKYQKYQQSKKDHDPLWDLDSNQLRSFMQAQVISKNNPGGDSDTVRQLYDRMPEGFFASRDAYFAKLKKSGVKFDESKYNTRPGMPDNLVAFSTNYHNLPYGTGARSDALRSPEGQAYIAWLNQNRLYNNQERADLGLPPLEDPSSQYASKGGSSSGGGRSGGGGSSGGNGFDPYKYAVSMKGGSVAKPKVRKIKQTKVAKAKISKPKVKIKKSLV